MGLDPITVLLLLSMQQTHAVLLESMLRAHGEWCRAKAAERLARYELECNVARAREYGFSV